MREGFLVCFERINLHSFTVTQEIGGEGVPPDEEQGIANKKARILWS
jgi:hypothetical protein